MLRARELVLLSLLSLVLSGTAVEHRTTSGARGLPLICVLRLLLLLFMVVTDGSSVIVVGEVEAAAGVVDLVLVVLVGEGEKKGGGASRVLSSVVGDPHRVLSPCQSVPFYLSYFMHPCVTHPTSTSSSSSQQ